jgi:mRNA-degrading endonuclease RelE of RelBE toxin-antitoxin system
LAHRLVLTRAARKDLDRLPREVLERADPMILALAENPRPFGSEKRVGKYRILYEIDKHSSIVTIGRKWGTDPFSR